MASNLIESLLQCNGCHGELNLASKTLPCLHSFCHSCLEKNFEGETSVNGQCPECYESYMSLNQICFSSFLVKPLRCRLLESTDWKCDSCSEDGNESPAQTWCHDCQKLYCANCSKWHKKFLSKHYMRDLDGMERGEVIKAMMTDMCSLHQKAKDSYCEQCNMCLCDTCYKNHSDDSPGCSSQPLSVREVALKQKSEGPTLAKEMDDLELSIRRLNERTNNYTKDLNSDCNLRCRQLWENVGEMIENAKQQTNQLCEEMKRMTDKQVKRWRRLLEENEKMLKQLEIWRLNLHHLLNESQQDADVICGLQLLGSKLSSQLQKLIGPEEKCQLEVTFPNWWLQALEQLKSEKIGSVSLTIEKLPAQNFVFEKQWNPCGSNLSITSILISKEDDHVFLCDYNNKSILEFTECGNFVCECKLFDETKKFKPFDMCSISSDIFFVACGDENKLIILERSKTPPFLQMKQIIHTERKFYSFCLINDLIITSDLYLQVDSITKEGKQIKILKTGRELPCKQSPLIRADPSNGNFWGTELLSSEIICYDSNGEEFRSVKTEGEIWDFCTDEFGNLFFCNKKGIFSLSSKKTLYIFEKESEFQPRIFIFRNKIFVCLRNDGINLIKIFKIFY